MMKNETAPKLSKRAERALEVLRAGGYFRRALETQHVGGEKFKTRLYTEGSTPWKHNAVRGIGYATLAELEKAGLLARRYCPKGSTWPTEWVLYVSAEPVIGEVV